MTSNAYGQCSMTEKSISSAHNTLWSEKDLHSTFFPLLALQSWPNVVSLGTGSLDVEWNSIIFFGILAIWIKHDNICKSARPILSNQ